MSEQIEGRNAVLEAFRSGKCVDKLFVLDRCQDGPVRTIIREARKKDTIINFVQKERLDQLSETGAHQGVIAQVAAYEYSTVEDILNKAKENINTIMPGYTHMQKAQPITFAHHIMAYAEMLKRDYGRLLDCYERMNEMPLGSGALATSTYPIDRNFVSNELGFNKPTVNSIDSVSDRDYAIEALSALSLIMMHLSRFSEEVILWCTGEFNFVELDDAYSTGSSIMPQKKNPDVAELVRGKTGRVYGDLMTLLTVMKGIPLAYNKDMQEDKEALFDGLDTVLISIQTFTGMLDTMKIKKDVMKKAASGGFTNATDVADYLVKKGEAFRNAHEIVGKIVLYCIDENKAIDDLSLDEFKSFSPFFEEDVYKAIDLITCVEERSVMGGPSSSSVQSQISLLENFISEKMEVLKCLK